jgi:hypothetical protein
MSAEGLEVEGDGIIVTLPGTALRVIYRKQAHSSGLVAIDVRGAPGAAISQVAFLTRAWKLANEKAREFGWIM